MRRAGGLWFDARHKKSDLARQSAREIGEVKVGKGGERRGYGWVVGATRACGLYTCMLRFVILLVFLVCASVPLFARGGT